MAESPESPLSSHASSEFTEDVKLEERDLKNQDHLMIPSAKRQRLMPPTYHPSPYVRFANADEAWDISSDSSGELPNSPLPISANMQDDDHGEQVTHCAWRGCDNQDLGNMDGLVDHIHEAHIGARQKRYTCEWKDCHRMGGGHASGYALRAHMRCHTREKPFYCTLAECDKSFTRSDALAKHMRTVHDIDALRLPLSTPQSHSAAPPKPQRLKLIVNSVKSVENDGEAEAGAMEVPLDFEVGDQAGSNREYPSDTRFSDEELRMPPDQLFRILRRRLHWTQKKHDELEEEASESAKKSMSEWQAKELVLSNLIEAELGTAAKAQPSAQEFATILRLKDEFLPVEMLPMTGSTPWYRMPPTQEVGNVGQNGATVE